MGDLNFFNLKSLKPSVLYFLLVLVVAFCVRTINLNSPVVGHHSWRQSQTASIIRNFAEDRYNLLYPQVDWGGGPPGYIESEFPIYQFISATGYKLFGIHECIPRLVSIFFGLLTIVFLYLLVKEICNVKAALWTAFFFSILPLSIYFGKAIMPTAMLLCLCTIALYAFYRWYLHNSLMMLVFSALSLSVAVMIKPYMLTLGLPLAYLSFRKFKIKTFIRPELLVFAVIVFVPSILWYYHAHQLELQTGLSVGVWGFGSDKWGNWNMVMTLDFWNRVLFWHFTKQHMAGFAVIPFVISMFLPRRSSDEKFFDFWLLAMLAFVVIVAKGNYVHDYYQMPLTMPVCIFLGKIFGNYFDLSNPKLRIQARALLILLILIIGGSAYKYTKLYQREQTDKILYADLPKAVSQNVDKDELIISLTKRGSPMILYHAHKRGWIVSAGSLNDNLLNDLKSQGASHIVGFHSNVKDVSSDSLILKLLENRSQIEYDDGKIFIINCSA